MSNINQFLKPGETVVDTITNASGGEVDYSIYVLERSDLSTGDEVLLEISSKLEPCVLIGGNPLKIDVVQGFGRLAIIDLKSGAGSEIFLEPGVEAEVPANNILYWYENMGEDQLILRDHCDDFGPANEPGLADVVNRLISLKKSA